MERYDVDFLKCGRCGSLQTEPPYWLEESYAEGLPGEDLDMVSRCQRAQVTVFFLTRLLGLKAPVRVLDYGGGNGLLVRMLRDIGIHATLKDKYIDNEYAAGFEHEEQGGCDLVTIFEVFEHLPFPAEDLRDVFAHDPQFVYGTTSIYRGQGVEWPYLCPRSGGHVFFYTAEGMRLLGEKFGYSAFVASPHVLFFRGTLSSYKKWYLKNMLFGRGRKLLNALYPLIRKKSLKQHDDQLMREKGLTRN